MTINLQKPDITELKPRITVFGVGGGGGNAVNNMINGGLQGVEFVVANTDAQALTMSTAEKVIQLGADVTEGLGAGSHPEVGAAAAEECMTEIQDHLNGTHMAFVTAGMGGGTGTGAAPVVARIAREMGILTVGVVTKPFQFEGQGRLKTADSGIEALQKHVDSLIVIPNQNLFRIANDKTTFADAFGMADQVLYSGVACITDLMVKEGLINLDFADVRSVMREMGKAMMGTGEASGEGRAMQAAEAAISNPLLDESSMRGAGGLLISITGGRDLTLFEVDEAATRIREEVDQEANIILGATFDEDLEGIIRVSVVATGIDNAAKRLEQQDTKDHRVEMVSRSTALPTKAAKAPSEMPLRTVTPVAERKSATAASIPAEIPPRIAEAKPSIESQGVKIEPFKPSNALFSDPEIEEEFRSALETELLAESDDFVLPAAEEPAAPAAAEIPVFEQASLRSNQPGSVMTPAPRAAPTQAPAPQQAVQESNALPVQPHGPMGLLNKLKNSFAGREEDEAIHSPASENRQTPPVDSMLQSGPLPRPSSTEPRVDDNPYAPKRHSMDDKGRINPSAAIGQEDEQLDIPAFLRRQAN
ncbi:MAG: cell division protein FtsZ [Pseudomonadota bacterium]